MTTHTRGDGQCITAARNLHRACEDVCALLEDVHAELNRERNKEGVQPPTETTHTPGEWEVDLWKYQGKYPTHTIIANKADAIAQALTPYRPESAEAGPEEAKANAYLMAASPRLLEALVRLTDCAGRTSPSYTTELGHAVRKARDAIAKATRKDGDR